MPEFTENIKFYSCDWKEHIPAQTLAKMIKDVYEATEVFPEVFPKVSDSVVKNCDDSVITAVWPGHIKLRAGEDVAEIIGYYHKAHITDDGKLFFTFKPESGMKSSRWFNVKDALVWIEGINCASELKRGNVSEDELERFKEAIAKAKVLA